MSVNKVFLIGRTGSDAIVRPVGDQKVAAFTLATSEKYKGKDGNLVESTEWHNIVIWGKLAEVAEKHVVKGTQLYIEGKIKTEKYTDKDGNERYATKIYASSMQMLGGKKDGQDASAPQQKFDPRSAHTTPMPDAGEPDDSDLPF